MHWCYISFCLSSTGLHMWETTDIFLWEGKSVKFLLAGVKKRKKEAVHQWLGRNLIWFQLKAHTGRWLFKLNCTEGLLLSQKSLCRAGRTACEGSWAITVPWLCHGPVVSCKAAPRTGNSSHWIPGCLQDLAATTPAVSSFSSKATQPHTFSVKALWGWMLQPFKEKRKTSWQGASHHR